MIAKETRRSAINPTYRDATHFLVHRDYGNTGSKLQDTVDSGWRLDWGGKASKPLAALGRMERTNLACVASRAEVHRGSAFGQVVLTQAARVFIHRKNVKSLWEAVQ